MDVTRPVWNYDGKPLEGGRFRAQLLAGPDVASLERVAEGIPFRVDGLFTEGTVQVPGVSAGDRADLQLAAWDTRTGATFEEATLRGTSSIFGLFLAGPLNPAPTLDTMESFYLQPTGNRVPMPAPAPPAENIIRNGSFEEGNNERIPSWVVECFGFRGNGGAADEAFLEFCERLRQSVATEAGKEYQLRFAYKRASEEDESSSPPMRVLWDDTEAAVVEDEKPGWEFFAGRVTGNGERMWLEFQSESSFHLDDVRLEPVRERLTVRFEPLRVLPVDASKVLLSLSAVGAQGGEPGIVSDELNVRVEVSGNLVDWEPLVVDFDRLRFRDRLHLVDDIDGPKYYRARIAKLEGTEETELKR